VAVGSLGIMADIRREADDAELVLSCQYYQLTLLGFAVIDSMWVFGILTDAKNTSLKWQKYS